MDGTSGMDRGKRNTWAVDGTMACSYEKMLIHSFQPRMLIMGQQLLFEEAIL